MRIDAEGVGIALGGKKILKEIHMSVRQKEFVGIIGPNGSGKSTFLKCIYRTLQPDCGQIFLDNTNLKDLTVRQSALKQAVLAQHNYYNFDFEVLDVVLMGRSPYKKIMDRDNEQDYKIARKNLKIVGLEEFENSKFSVLSGGEQQRVMLARALTQETPCLLLDEPTNHLDIKYQLQLMDIVKRMNVTVIAAIHDLNIAAMYCDRMIAMKQGSIVGSGPPVELLTEEFIYDLYEVKADIIHLPDERITIVYKSGGYE